MVDAKLSMNIFDLVVILVLFLSALLSMYRGFMREVLSLASWIGAAAVTLYLVKPVAELLLPYVKNQQFAATIIAALGVYFFTLIVFSILSSIFVRYIKDAGEVGSIDHFLGALFGVAKAAFIIVLAFLLYSQVVSADDYPDWLKTAASRPYVERGAKMLVAAMPEYLGEVTAFAKKAEGEAEGQKIEGNDMIPQQDGSAGGQEGPDTQKAFENLLNSFGKSKTNEEPSN